MTENITKKITYRIHRYDPEADKAPHWEEYPIAWKKGMTILEGLIYIKENLDSTLAFRTSCRMGICGSCAMWVNDMPRLACATQIEELNSEVISLRSLPNMPIIKDLASDLSKLFANHKSIKPYIIRYDKKEMEDPTQEYKQTNEELAKVLQFSYCIKCGICVASCPTAASDKYYLGPQALTQCYRYSADTRDGGENERLSTADTSHGVWHCHFANSCSEACPKGVDPALAIQLLKRKLSGKALGMSKKQEPCVLCTPSTEKKPKVEFPPLTVKQEAKVEPKKEIKKDKK